MSKCHVTNNECGTRLFIQGAFTFNNLIKRQQLQAEANAILKADEEAFQSALPMPADAPQPTPTTAPTASPTSTPTGSPTATPTSESQ